MPVFRVNVPITTGPDQPTIIVLGGLRTGDHRFRLVVLDDRGNKSAPSEIVVRVQEGGGPPVGGPDG